MELFVHRRDVFAEQQRDGAYYPQRRELTGDDVAEHLAGFASYGTYVIDPISPEHRAQPLLSVVSSNTNTIKYVVFDLDTYDEAALEHLKWCVRQLIDDLKMDDGGRRHKCLLLESSGGKGFHVWLFLSEPIPAVQVRRWLGYAFWPLWLEAAAAAPEWPALEVFPKQDSVDEGGFGNLVKLPFGVHAKTGNKSEVVPVTDWASAVDEVVALDVQLIPAISDSTPEAGSGLSPSDAPRGRTPFPCIDRILTGDVYPGIRDNAIFHLSLFLYGQGLDQELALEQCRKVSGRMEHPLRDSEVVAKVRSAYSGRHRGGCGASWLRDFCPGPCPKFAGSMGTPSSVLQRAKPGDIVQVEVVEVNSAQGRKRVTVKHNDAQNTPTLVVGE